MSMQTYRRDLVLAKFRSAFRDLEDLWKAPDDAGVSSSLNAPSSSYTPSYTPYTSPYSTPYVSPPNTDQGQKREFDASIVRASEHMSTTSLRRLIDDAKRAATLGRSAKIFGYVGPDNQKLYLLRRMSGVDARGQPFDHVGRPVPSIATLAWNGYPSVYRFPLWRG